MLSVFQWGWARVGSAIKLLGLGLELEPVGLGKGNDSIRTWVRGDEAMHDGCIGSSRWEVVWRGGLGAIEKPTEEGADVTQWADGARD